MSELILGAWLTYSYLSGKFKPEDKEFSKKFHKEYGSVALKSMYLISLLVFAWALIPNKIFTKYQKYLEFGNVARLVIIPAFIISDLRIFQVQGKQALYYKDEILSVNPSLIYFFPKTIEEETKEKTIEEKTEEKTIEKPSNILIQDKVATKEIFEEKEPINSLLWDIRYGDAEYRKKLAYKYFVYNLNRWIEKDKEENIPFSDKLWGKFIFVTAIIHISSLPLVYMCKLWINKPFEARVFWIFQFPILNVIALAGVAFFDSEYYHYLELMGIKYESQILKFEPGLKKRFMINPTLDN